MKRRAENQINKDTYSVDGVADEDGKVFLLFALILF